MLYNNAREITRLATTVLNQVGDVSDTLTINYGNISVCILNHHYSWLQQLPDKKHFAITTIFDDKGKVVQWYIDICYQNGVENGVPFLDDLYLDVVVLPTGEIILLDEDELEDALLSGDIDRNLYDVAWNEAKAIMMAIEEENFELLHYASEHRLLLQE
ncbi:DUF402 domain-containing protein [Ornithinibacillus xuwenensis]|uniref:DUF402 domain-containing protein n=1 Tax=Ornithinibacillus xuwenensis TaxID=3144668 RepID=A0ABU9XFU2_9BACI